MYLNFFKCQSSSVLKLLSPSEFPCFYISFNARIHMSLHFFQRQCSGVDKCILMPDFFQHQSWITLDFFQGLSSGLNIYFNVRIQVF